MNQQLEQNANQNEPEIAGMEDILNGGDWTDEFVNLLGETYAKQVTYYITKISEAKTTAKKEYYRKKVIKLTRKLAQVLPE